MTKTMLSFFFILPLVASAEVTMRTIVKDKGHLEKEKVDAVKICNDVVQEELLKNHEAKIKLKDSSTLKVFRTDSSFGFAAKCLIQVTTKPEEKPKEPEVANDEGTAEDPKVGPEDDIEDSDDEE